MRYPMVEMVLADAALSATRAQADHLLQIVKRVLPSKGVKVSLVGSLKKNPQGKDIDLLLTIDWDEAPDTEEPFWWPLLEKAGLECVDSEALWMNPKTDEYESIESWRWNGIAVDLFFNNND